MEKQNSYKIGDVVMYHDHFGEYTLSSTIKQIIPPNVENGEPLETYSLQAGGAYTADELRKVPAMILPKENTYYENLCEKYKEKLGAYHLGVGSIITDNSVNHSFEIIKVDESGFEIKRMQHIGESTPEHLSFEHLENGFDSVKLNIAGLEHTEQGKAMLHYAIRSIIECELKNKVQSEIHELKESEHRKLQELTNLQTLKEGGEIDKSKYYVIAFDSGSKGTRYIDNEDSKYGTSDEYSAMPFDTKDEAIGYINKHNYIGWVEEVTPFIQDELEDLETMEVGDEIDEKTQINELVSGSTHVGSQGVVGTSHDIRKEVAKKVIEENPESMLIEIRGHKIKLSANWSLSRKSVHYAGKFPLDLYKEMFGNSGIIKDNPEAYIIINGDMTANAQTNSKKMMWQNIPEKEIKILNENKMKKGGKINSSEEIAEKLMEIDGKVWDSLHVKSGGQLYSDITLQKKYKQSLDKQIGDEFELPFSQEVHDILEDSNFHSLNQYLYLSRSFGIVKKNEWLKFLDKPSRMEAGKTNGESGLFLSPTVYSSNEKDNVDSESEAIEMLTEMLPTLKGKEKKECQEAIKMLKEMNTLKMKKGGFVSESDNKLIKSIEDSEVEFEKQMQRRDSFKKFIDTDFKAKFNTEYRPEYYSMYSADRKKFVDEKQKEFDKNKMSVGGIVAGVVGAALGVVAIKHLAEKNKNRVKPFKVVYQDNNGYEKTKYFDILTDAKKDFSILKKVNSFISLEKYNKVKNEYDLITYNKGISKYEKGGSVQNNYEGKTPSEVWNAWTEYQREHFLSDHKDKIDHVGNLMILNNTAYESLPYQVKDAITHHVESGEYEKGGKVGKVMEEFQKGKLKTSHGKKVTNKKQSIAIGLSEARKNGEKVKPLKKSKKHAN